MKKSVVYLASIFLGFGLLLSLWLGLFYLQLGKPTQHSYWTNALVTNKLLAAHKIAGEKIVFIAGSSGNFNIDAERISKTIQVQAVNLGTHAILPLEYMLDHTKDELRSGDTVVLALEYLYFAGDERLSEAYIDYLLARDPNYFRHIPLAEKIEIISHVSLKRLLAPIRESFFPIPPAYAFNVYTEFFFSPYGDSHSNNLVFLTKQMRDLRATAPPELRILSLSAAKNNWLLLSEFANWCKEKNIALLAVPPATMNFEVYTKPEYRDGLAALRESYAKIGINFIGNPYEVMYDPDFFFDTNYHTNQLGKDAYTDSLITWITPYIKPHQEHKPTVGNVETPVDNALKDFNGWMPIAGLQTLEGPYPASHFPVVAWGAPKVILQVNPVASGMAKFQIQFMPNLDKQPLAVFVDDAEIYSATIVKISEFQNVEFTFPITKGKHLITIKSSAESSSDSGTSLLFKTVLFTSPSS